MGTNTERPNLLYIHSDQHNPAVIGCYGDPLVQTPNLDSLAAKGVRFTNVYCPSPVCVPSRMSMLAGRYPSEIEVWTNNHIMDSGIPTFAHAMGAAGYNPVLIGRMHGLGPDQLHGYAERLVGDHGGNYPGNGVAPSNMRASLQQAGSGQSSYQVHDEDVTAATVNYLDRLGVQKRAGLANGTVLSLCGIHASAFPLRGTPRRLRTLPRCNDSFPNTPNRTPTHCTLTSSGGVSGEISQMSPKQRFLGHERHTGRW